MGTLISWRGLREALGGARVVHVLSARATTGGRGASSAVRGQARRGMLARSRPSDGAKREPSHFGRLLAQTKPGFLQVKAKNIRVGDFLDGRQVVHKETMGNRGKVLLTLADTGPTRVRPWLWSNELVEVQRGSAPKGARHDR